MTQTQKEMLQYFAVTVFRNILKMFWIFPVKQNRILFISHSGTQYSCNPKYISKYLRKEYPRKFEAIFSVQDPEKWKQEEEHFVKFASIRNFYYFCTAKVIVSNCGMPTYIPKRKQQYAINTWHGGGAYKINIGGGNTERDAVSRWRVRMNQYKSRSTDLVLSSCESFSRLVVPELVYQYHGEIMPCGMPRNDIVYHTADHSAVRRKVCSFYHQDVHKKIVLYAPTFRGNFDNIKVHATNEFSIDLKVKDMLDTVRTRFHVEPVLMIRAHYAMSIAAHLNDSNTVDVSEYPDTQELLCATDILISDYSSIIWDFSLTGRPCFLYVPDLDYYLNQDRGVYTPVENWPGILCQTNEELQNAVLEFDTESYEKKVEKHHRDLGSYETGTACEQVCRRIAEVCGVNGVNKD